MRAVLDAWAVTALLNDEPAAERVERLLTTADCVMSSVNLGEVYYTALRGRGERAAQREVERIRAVVDVEDPNWPLVRAAAEIKARGGLSYADAFCVATAMRHGAPLYTGDPEITRLEADVEVIDLRSST